MHTEEAASVTISASVTQADKLAAQQQRKQHQPWGNVRITDGDVHDKQMRAVSQSLRKTLQQHVSAADGAIAAAEQATLEAVEHKKRVDAIADGADVKTWAMLDAERQAHVARVEMKLVEHRTRDAAFALAARIERVDSQVGDGSNASPWSVIGKMHPGTESGWRVFYQQKGEVPRTIHLRGVPSCTQCDAVIAE